MCSEVTNDKEDFMINKKEKVVYGINLTNLRKEYDDVINPKNSMTYTFWKEHVIETIKIGSNETVDENLSHYLTNEERKKASELDFGSNLLLSFVLFFGSCLLTLWNSYLDMTSNAVNQILGLIEKENNMPEKLPKLYNETNLVFSNILVSFTIIVIILIGCLLFLFLPIKKDKLIKEIGFLRDLNQIIKDIKRL